MRSKHLVQECSERALQGLLAAMRRGGGGGAAANGGAAAAGPGAEGEAGAAGDAAMDDLLFFADTEGDTTMFGRWGGRGGRGSSCMPSGAAQNSHLGRQARLPACLPACSLLQPQPRERTSE